MAITAVQAVSLTSDASSANASVTATSGNALIVGGSAFTGAVAGSGFTASRTGDTFTTDSEGSSAGATLRHRQGICSAPNVTGGAVTLTVSCTSGQAIDAWGLEFSGLPTSNIRDATSPAVATGNSGTATTNSLTNATADAVFITVLGSESGANPATVTDPTNYTGTVGGTTMHRTNGSADQVGGMAYRVVSSTGAETPAWTTTSAQWTAGIAVYKAAPSGPPPPYVAPVVTIPTYRPAVWPGKR